MGYPGPMMSYREQIGKQDGETWRTLATPTSQPFRGAGAAGDRVGRRALSCPGCALANHATCLFFALGLPAVMSTSTFRPAAVTMLTSVSIVNSPILPRTRSEIRGCDTAMILAARDWVTFLSWI